MNDRSAAPIRCGWTTAFAAVLPRALLPLGRPVRAREALLQASLEAHARCVRTSYRPTARGVASVACGGHGARVGHRRVHPLPRPPLPGSAREPPRREAAPQRPLVRSTSERLAVQ